MDEDNGEIVCMDVDVDGKVLVCGCWNQENDRSRVVFYSILSKSRKERLFSLKPVLKVELEYFIHSLSIKQNMVMISMFNKVVFMNIKTRQKQLTISKKDLQVTTGILVQCPTPKKKYKNTSINNPSNTHTNANKTNDNNNGNCNVGMHGHGQTWTQIKAMIAIKL